MSEDDSMFEERGYRVLEVLGRNLQGGRITYLCEPVEGGDPVVLKTFSFARGEADWSGYKAHERELAILEGLDHPQIPKILGAFPLEDGFVMVQEWRDAATLAAPRVWTVDEVVDVAEQVLSVLVYLQSHAPAIVHRDIKPENILRDDGGRVSLIDFGFARPQSAEGNASSVAMGTPGYMAPEQMLNQPVDASTDLYGVGATLVALGSGVASGELSKLVSSSFRLPMDRLDAGFSQEWKAWLEKMTEPDRAQRFASARAARAALDLLEPDAARAEAMARAEAPRKTPKKAPKKASRRKKGRGSFWAGTMTEDPRWLVALSVVLGVAILLVMLSPILSVLFRSDEPSHTNYDFMVWEGDEFTCIEPGSRVFDGPANGVERLDEVVVGNGCELTLSGVTASSVKVGAASRVVLEDVRVRWLRFEGDGEAEVTRGALNEITGGKGRARLRDVTFEVFGYADEDAYGLDATVVCERCTFTRFTPKYDFWREGVEIGSSGRVALIAPRLDGMPIWATPYSHVEVLPEGVDVGFDRLSDAVVPAHDWVRKVDASGAYEADRLACRGFTRCLLVSPWVGATLDVSMELGPTGMVTKATGTYPDGACFEGEVKRKDVGAVGFGGGSLECVLGLARPQGQLVVTEHVGVYVRSESTVEFERKDDSDDE